MTPRRISSFLAWRAARRATQSPTVDRAQRAISIGRLFSAVFLGGLLVTVLVVLIAFNGYRSGAVTDMALVEGGRVSHLVFEHLYSVMRKGLAREEIDDLVHHIQNQLPNFEVAIHRGEPVARQFGERPGQSRLLREDAALRQAFASGQDTYVVGSRDIRYLYPVRMAAECMLCHVQSGIGEVNGVISVRVPLAELERPLLNIARPIMWLALGLVLGLFLVIYLVLRRAVIRPIVELAEHVAELSEDGEYGHGVRLSAAWPREVRSLAGNFDTLMAQVRISHEQLREASLRDPLTGLFNRRHFDAACSQAAADRVPYGLIMIDLDRFKPINDRYGHAAGDALLIRIAEALQACLRETDLAARLGGDEFAVLAVATSPQQLDELAERVRRAIQSVEVRFGPDTVRPACSLGTAAFAGDGVPFTELLRRADAAMYAEKRARGHRQ